MDEPIPHPNDVLPWNLRVLLPRLTRDTSRGLSENLDALDQGEQEHSVGIEIGAAPAMSEALRFLRGVEHVPQAVPIARRHIAPRPMRRHLRGNTR
jgi:hypothetical protein